MNQTLINNNNTNLFPQNGQYIFLYVILYIMEFYTFLAM